MPFYLGVDLGFTGAIAIVGHEGQLIELHDMPVMEWVSKGKARKDYSITEILNLLRPWAQAIRYACLEEVRPRPPIKKKVEGKDVITSTGSAASYWAGRGSGVFETAFHALEISHYRVTPKVWKAHYQLTGADKGKSRVIAARLYPGAAVGRVKDDGRAEALLLARYVMEKQDVLNRMPLLGMKIEGGSA